MNQAVILNQALSAHHGGYLDEAMRLYREVLALNPAHVEANYGIGRVYYEYARFSEARASFKAAADGNPAFADAYLGLAFVERALGNFDQAFDHFRQARRARPDYVDAAALEDDLGHSYGEYSRLINHWRSVETLPMLDVQYEQLVRSPETQLPRIIEFCGLPWDDACSRYYASGRVTKTASYNQVQRPLYTSAIGRWRNYEKHLTPLFESLKGLV